MDGAAPGARRGGDRSPGNRPRRSDGNSSGSRGARGPGGLHQAKGGAPPRGSPGWESKWEAMEADLTDAVDGDALPGSSGLALRFIKEGALQETVDNPATARSIRSVNDFVAGVDLKELRGRRRGRSPDGVLQATQPAALDEPSRLAAPQSSGSSSSSSSRSPFPSRSPSPPQSQSQLQSSSPQNATVHVDLLGTEDDTVDVEVHALGSPRDIHGANTTADMDLMVIGGDHLELTVDEVLREDNYRDDEDAFTLDHGDAADLLGSTDYAAAVVIDKAPVSGLDSYPHGGNHSVKLPSTRGLRSMWKLWCVLVMLSLVELALVISGLIFDRLWSPCREPLGTCYNLHADDCSGAACLHTAPLWAPAWPLAGLMCLAAPLRSVLRGGARGSKKLCAFFFNSRSSGRGSRCHGACGVHHLRCASCWPVPDAARWSSKS